MALRPKEYIELNSTPVTETGCWLWDKYCDKDGYGKATENSYPCMAHRLSYTLYKGAIPKGMLICHSCDQPGCVNPDHLFTGTARDNARDMHAKGRQAVGITFKLTDVDVAEIRTKYADGILQSAIAAEYNMDQGYVSAIVNNKRRVC